MTNVRQDSFLWTRRLAKIVIRARLRLSARSARTIAIVTGALRDIEMSLVSAKSATWKLVPSAIQSQAFARSAKKAITWSVRLGLVHLVQHHAKHAWVQIPANSATQACTS